MAGIAEHRASPCSMSFDLASQMSFRTAGWIDKSASARAHAAHLQDGIFLDRDIMGNVGRLGVKAAGAAWRSCNRLSSDVGRRLRYRTHRRPWRLTRPRPEGGAGREV